MAQDVTLLMLLQDLLRRWKVVAAVTLALFLGAVFYAESLPSEYRGSSVVAFSPRPEAAIGGDTLRVVLPKYVAYATAGATVNRVAGGVGERPSVLRAGVSASITADSANLTISATMPTGARAAAAANALAAEVVRFADADELLRAVVVAPALPSTAPSGPPRRLIEAAALLVGLLAGAIAAFVLERGRPRIRSWRDVAVVTGYPVLGRIPSSRALKGGGVADALADPAVGAAARTLRTNLERSSREKPVYILLVTSSLPGEGKTTVAATLAASLGRLDAQVLLMDADLRRPGLTKAMGASAEPGLATVLRGEAPFDDALRPGPVPNLVVLPTAPDVDAGDLLARHIAEILREARRRFDVVIVDAPPLLGGDDARTLATLADAVLLVVGADTVAASVNEAAAALDTLGVRVIGAVANRSREPRGLGSYGAYGSYATSPTP